jgi:hypothetical protein
MKSKTNKQNLCFDHAAIVMGANDASLQKAERLFKILGFGEKIYDRGEQGVGNDETKMKTSVVKRDNVKFALMEGIDGQDKDGQPVCSQITEYFRRFGVCVQHIAIRCNNLKSLTDELFANGIKFITENEDGTPRLLTDRDEEGRDVLQCFTYPIDKTFFFEFKQVIDKTKSSKHLEEFRDQNVEGLWASIDKKVKDGTLFKINILGEVEQTHSYTYPELAQTIKHLATNQDNKPAFANMLLHSMLQRTIQEMIAASEL